ncbi:MAG: GGDEF domain-containing protein [Ruminococcus sp.]|nr:GGDEF domain-containing protein [Ruminococcus sp.]
MNNRKRIALFTACPEYSHVKRVIDGVTAQCLKYDYDLLVFCALSHLESASEEYALGEKNIFNLINYDMVDGVILDTAHLLDGKGQTHLDKIYGDIKSKCHKPVVALDMPVHDIPMIENENEEILREMVRHAVNKHNKRKLCFISGPVDNYAGRYRMEIFLDEARKLGIDVADEHIVYGDFWYNGGSALGQEIAEGIISMPDAILCGNDYLAIGVIYRLEKYGIRVPEDIIVIGFDSTDEGKGNKTTVSSYEPNDILSASKCVDHLRRYIDPDKDIIPYESDGECGRFIPAMSCGCEPDYTKSIQAIYDHIYFNAPNYTDEDVFNNADIGLLMESYIFESFTASKSYEDLIQDINMKTYLLLPFVNFYLCLKKDWLDTNNDIQNGYPEVMKIVAANTKNKELYFHSEAESITFDTKLMIPRLHDNQDKQPSVYYFSPVHFESKAFGYSVIQRWMNDPHRLTLVYRNWLRFVNNALEMVRSKLMLMSISVHDEMTGALNRRGMYLELEKKLAAAKKDDAIFVCVIDMDGLKYINDTFGHTEGDFGIKVISNAVSAITGPNEIFVRAGGDEFYIIGVGDYDESSGETRTEKFNKILDIMAQTYEKPYNITASIGSDVGKISGDTNIDDIINKADERMYRYKVEHKRQRRDVTKEG